MVELSEKFGLYPITSSDVQELISYKEEFAIKGEMLNGGLQLQRYKSIRLWRIHVFYCSLPYWCHVFMPCSRIYCLKEVGNDRILGLTVIRLTKIRYFLEQGGHIGYSIRPSERQKGYGRLILSLAKKKCNEFGIPLCHKII